MLATWPEKILPPPIDIVDAFNNAEARSTWCQYLYCASKASELSTQISVHFQSIVFAVNDAVARRQSRVSICTSVPVKQVN